ncbi:uracil-DNA glycosylase [Janthinobacterium sp. B9-8]|uniref:uracil-DNA glycosylase n=1 Tax=Janthinobacterium sp. B9-8 TaxID=1236179 RepID=UPI00061CE060|nr:uracil-DNA glycosylase [Janthinobacterium sp. B9-8]AMC34181.1 uracil-DNA glycosylase [Janthinobacterium sp. B9-8]
MTLPAAWQPLVSDVLQSAKWQQLSAFLDAELAAGKLIYPKPSQWFAALEYMKPEQVRVVVLGQDPYHGAGQAHGLSFSVPIGVKPPPSLVNIFKEVARDLGHSPPQHGNLEPWAAQGVLLLNCVLTVEADKAASHARQGWEALTDALIKSLAEQHSHIVFMLWGAYAQKKQALIDANRHCILCSAHPSPLSVYRGFIGNGHFSAANRYLLAQGKSAILWEISE